MHKESLTKIIGLACIGLLLFPILWGKDFLRKLRRQPTCHELLFAAAIKKVK